MTIILQQYVNNFIIIVQHAQSIKIFKKNLNSNHRLFLKLYIIQLQYVNNENYNCTRREYQHIQNPQIVKDIIQITILRQSYVYSWHYHYTKSTEHQNIQTLNNKHYFKIIMFIKAQWYENKNIKTQQA